MVEIGMGENKGANPSYLGPWVGEAGVVGVRRLDVRLLLIGVPYGRDPPATGSRQCAGSIVHTGDSIQDGVDGLGSDGLGVDDVLRILLLHRRHFSSEFSVLWKRRWDVGGCVSESESEAVGKAQRESL